MEHIRSAVVRFSLACALALSALIALPAYSFGVKVSFVPTTVVQPDGAQLHLYASGDEFFNYIHTSNGSLVMQNDEGNYVFAVKRFDGVLVPGEVRVDAHPVARGVTVDKVNIRANARAKNMMQDLIDSTRPKYSTDGTPLNASGSAEASETVTTTPSGDTELTKSDITNIVCYIRFADEAEFAPAQVETDNELLNTGAYSLNKYIKAQSYDECSFTSVFPKGGSATVESFCPTQTRSYFQPYNATTNPNGYQDDTERDTREHVLLQQAVAWLNQKSDLPDGATLDQNSDGAVDSIMFIINGDAGEWNSLLWPHQWDMGTYQATLSGKAVSSFSFQLQNFDPDRKLSTYCHETMHVLGFPDLYRYYATGDPIASWDIMNQDTAIPQYANAYMRKTIADWGPAIGLAKVGENTVRAPYASGTEPISLALPITTQQSFVFEYRRAAANTFDQLLPSSGLLPYRVLTTSKANAYGNMYGPNYYPDGYYIFRPGVTAWGSIPWYNSAGYGLGASMGGGTAPETWTLSSSNGRSTYGAPNTPADSLFVYGGTQVEYYIGDVTVNTGDTISFKLNTVNDFNNYIVDFDTQGGSPVPASQSIYAGHTSTEPTVTPQRSGYTFEGWFSSKDATQTFDFANTKIMANTTLYAHWKELPITPAETTLDTPSTTVEKATPITLSGHVMKDTETGALSVIDSRQSSTLRNAGGSLVPVEGVTVYLQTSTDGGATWTTDPAVSDITDAAGLYELTFTPEESVSARAYVPAQLVGSTKLAEQSSGSIEITVNSGETTPTTPIPASSSLTIAFGAVVGLVVAGYALRKRAIDAG